MNSDVILADSVAFIPHIALYDLLAKHRLKNLSLQPIFIYYIDTVDAAVLPYLAEQFGVSGIRGYNQASTDLERRKIIKRAIELYRYRGTLWAVEEALASVGYGDAIVTEHYGHWARFRVTLDINQYGINIQNVAEAYRLVMFFKNTRSTLDGIIYTGLNFDDSVQAVDDGLVLNVHFGLNDVVYTQQSFLYDGAENYDGSNSYGGDGDGLTINIFP